ADRHAWHDDGSMADPHVVSDRNVLRTAALTKLLVDALEFEELIWSVSDLVRRHPLHRVLQRVDPHIRGNRAEFPDDGVDRLAVPLEIAEVADLHLAQHDPLTNDDVTAELAGFQLRSGMNARIAVRRPALFLGHDQSRVISI